MERIDQAIALLKDCKSKGLSYCDAHRQLVQNGFSDTEIAEAADRFDYQGFSAPHAPSKQQSGAIPSSHATPDSQTLYSQPVLINENSTPTRSKWINSAQAQVILCALSIMLVWFVGQTLINMKGILPLILFFCLVALSAATILYYGFVAKVIALGRFGQFVIKGGFAALGSLLWLVFLGIATFELLRH